MLGMKMMLDSLGVNPEDIQRQAAEVVRGVEEVKTEIDRQGRLLDAIARHVGIDPREIPRAENPKEIDHE